MKRSVLFLAALLVSGVLAAQTLPELFQTAKQQIKASAWQDALKTLDTLDMESAKPGNETVRSQLQAPVSFYRGVCEANLGQAEKARAEFAVFLQTSPNSTMDPAMYSKKAVAAFEEARKDAVGLSTELGVRWDRHPVVAEQRLSQRSRSCGNS